MIEKSRKPSYRVYKATDTISGYNHRFNTLVQYYHITGSGARIKCRCVIG